jgi:hypothetical protein
MFAQNQDKNIYKSAIEIIKSSAEFAQFVKEYDIKEINFSVHEPIYPMCVFCSVFDGYVNCCISDNWLAIWPNQKVDNLPELGNSHNKKFTLLFTNTESSYFVSELSHKNSKNKNLLFLFQITDGKIALIKTAIYLAK